MRGLTRALLTWRWAGVDSVGEQKKLKARKCLKNAAEPRRPLHALLSRASIYLGNGPPNCSEVGAVHLATVHSR